MNVLLVDNCLLPVTLYGGTGRIVWYLGKELVNMGHRVTFLVRSGSTCDFARVLFFDANKPIAEQIPEKTDIVHFHNNPASKEALTIPYILTHHGNRSGSDEMDKNTVFVSKNHAERFGSDSFVYNGLDWDDYSKPDLTNKRSYFHFLGNAAWKVKNVRGAIDLINKMPSQRLTVLGGDRFNFKMGMRFTFSPKIRFKGMVGGEKKCRLINGSKGLLFPVKWNEPFGLAITESLYYGCPVFGTPYGSLPELITNKVGFLTNKSSEMAEALINAESYSRQECHDYVVENFNSKKMALDYLKKYETALSNQPLNLINPRRPNPPEPRYLEWV
jgi:glycosyltransferase involved in cell wall biosynthesis